MKKAHWFGFIAAFCMVVTGLLLRNVLHVLDIVLVIAGISLFLFSLLLLGIRQSPRCPHCGTVVYRGLPALLQQRGGMLPCRKCGVPVCVDHSAKRK